MQRKTVSLCLVLTLLFLLIKNKATAKQDMTFCEQETASIDVTQYPHGSLNSMIAPILPAGADHRSCFIKLEQIPDYSWCGVHFTTLELRGSDVFNIQSGIDGDLVRITQSTLAGGFYIPTLNKTFILGKSLNFIKLHLLQYPIVGSALSSEIALSYTVAHVMMDEMHWPRYINTPPGSRGFIVSHKQFDFGTARYRSGRVRINSLSLVVGERARVDIKFHYINLKTDTSGGCDSLLKFDSVNGCTDSYYFELCARTTTDAEWDYHLYPLFDDIRLTLDLYSLTGFGFLLEYKVIKENQQTGAGCDINFIKNADLVETRPGGGIITYNMTCRSGTTTDNRTSTYISCDSDGWRRFTPCTRDITTQSGISVIPGSLTAHTTTREFATSTTGIAEETGDQKLLVIIGVPCGLAIVIIIIATMVIVVLRQRKSASSARPSTETTHESEEDAMPLRISLHADSGAHRHINDGVEMDISSVGEQTPIQQIPTSQHTVSGGNPDDMDINGHPNYENTNIERDYQNMMRQDGQLTLRNGNKSTQPQGSQATYETLHQNPPTDQSHIYSSLNLSIND